MRMQLWGRMLNKLAFVAPGGFGVRPRLQKWRGVRIGANVWISQYVYLDEIHPECITIQDNCSIGLRTSIIAHMYWGPRQDSNVSGTVSIMSDTFVGPHCVILPGVTIGSSVVIQAGTAVSRNVPSGVLWGGSPGRPLARVTVPLTREFGHEAFSRGLKPLRKKEKGG
ncbi:MAG TPA: acyltransferase [Desulfomicrobiaceae bacterium]|nr:acyltransferase [Desulfomicrobiaceae bacterium]